MSRVLVVGGTGLAGRAVAAEALARDHEVVVASRRVPESGDDSFVSGAVYVAADVVSGDGLEEAVDGVDVIVDTTNAPVRSAGHVFESGSQNLLHTAARFGVAQAVLLSIVNVDRSAYRYYRAKAAQERSYQESPIESRILRTTQFHDFVTSVFERGSRFGIVPAPAHIRFQPIAVSDVARLLVDAAEGAGDADATRTVGGPAVETSRTLAERWRDSTGTRRPIVPLRIGGPLGATLRSGANLAPEAAIDGLSYDDWLSEFVA